MKNNSNLIGVGSYGEVYKVALKKIKKILVSEAEFKTEINILKELECEYSVKYIDHYETNNEYNLILELCDCNLRDILNEYKKINKGLPINIIKKILKQLNVVMKKMNESNITHRDIKPENILIKFLDEKKEDFNIKLSDYGTGKELNSTKSNLTVVGTNKYMAPEVEDGVYNNKVDLWSIGVLIYELYYNDYIFKGNNVKETFENRYNCKIVRDIPDDNLNNLLKKLIQPKDKRIDFDEYYNDNFFKENENNKNEFNDNDDNEFDRYYSKEEIEEQKKTIEFYEKQKKNIENNNKDNSNDDNDNIDEDYIENKKSDNNNEDDNENHSDNKNKNNYNNDKDNKNNNKKDIGPPCSYCKSTDSYPIGKWPLFDRYSYFCNNCKVKFDYWGTDLEKNGLKRPILKYLQEKS